MPKHESNPKTPRSDERNIVGASQIDINDLESTVYLIWEKNKNLILGGVAAVIIAFVGFNAFKFLQRSSEAKTQAAYLEATTPADKLAFAQSKSGHPLSGFAFKEAGDTAFAQGDFAAAESRYREAVDSAEGVIKDAANIGLALALMSQDKDAEAAGILQALAQDPDSASHAEAQYRLAQLASKAGDTEGAKAHIDAIGSESPFWQSRGQALAQRLP